MAATSPAQSSGVNGANGANGAKADDRTPPPKPRSAEGRAARVQQLGLAIRNAYELAQDMRRSYPHEDDPDWQVCLACLGTALEAARFVAARLAEQGGGEHGG